MLRRRISDDVAGWQPSPPARPPALGALQGIGKNHPDGEEAGRLQRLAVMRKMNPVFVLREAAISKALGAAQDGGGAVDHPP